jgi:pimeloyl-ACP methyl ester carboxylesterase
MFGLLAAFQSMTASPVIPVTAVAAPITHTASSTQSTAVPTRQTLSNGTVVVLPPGFDAQKTYPALILMPPTNRTASEFFNWAMSETYRKRTGEPFVVILPSERGSRGDYSSGGAFEASIAYYERSVRNTLKVVTSRFTNIDSHRIAIGGFSLGADLAWAISIRNPDLFRSAILIDSLCTYRQSKYLDQLSAKKFRYVLIAGRKEGGEANHPMVDVKTILDQKQIANTYTAFPNASHYAIIEMIPDRVWMQAIDYALFEE